jgi:membrane-associated phospholipid phosphatase
MIRKIFSFVLRSRLEDVTAVGVSAVLLVLFLTTELFHSFNFGMLDFLFILLPIGILGVKSLFSLLLSSESKSGENPDTGRFLVQFFQPLLKIFRDWFPFLLLSACYYSLYSNLILRVNPYKVDAFLSKIDAFILGNQPSFLLQAFIRPGITDFLYLVYFSHVIFFPSVALYFYLKKEEKAFRRLMMGLMTIMLMGITSYILVPAVGPESYFADQYTRNLAGQTLSRSVAYIISVGRVAYDCFPSLHVGIPLLISFYLRDYRRKAFIPALIYVALMSFATIYLRYHYLIDVIAAFAYAPAAYFLNDFLLRHWPGEQISRPSLEIKKHKKPAGTPTSPDTAGNEANFSS